MTEQQSQNKDIDSKQAAIQADRFRFCDLSHPVMQQLINLQLKQHTTTQHDFD